MRVFQASACPSVQILEGFDNKKGLIVVKTFEDLHGRAWTARLMRNRLPRLKLAPNRQALLQERAVVAVDLQHLHDERLHTAVAGLQ